MSRKEVAASKPQPRLIILSAPSGAGKTTLCSLLIKDFPNIGLSLSCTTRAIRPGETDGVHYHFLTEKQFQDKIKRGEFAEWAEVHGKLYGTPKSEVESRIQAKKHVLFDIDVQGALNLQKLYGERALLIFIHPPSMEILEKRLRDRKSDSSNTIETRLRNAYNELGWSNKFHYQITNDELNRAYRELKEIIQKEC